MWSVSSILAGLQSFFYESTSTTGSVTASRAEKRRLAAASMAFNVKNASFRRSLPGPRRGTRGEGAAAAATTAAAAGRHTRADPRRHTPTGPRGSAGGATGACEGARRDTARRPRRSSPSLSRASCWRGRPCRCSKPRDARDATSPEPSVGARVEMRRRRHACVRGLHPRAPRRCARAFGITTVHCIHTATGVEKRKKSTTIGARARRPPPTIRRARFDRGVDARGGVPSVPSARLGSHGAFAEELETIRRVVHLRDGADFLRSLGGFVGGLVGPAFAALGLRRRSPRASEVHRPRKRLI